MKHIIFINGAPRSGKDTIGAMIKEKLGAQKTFKFADELKRRTHAKFGLKVPNDHFEAVKDIVLTEFDYQTPRQAYINFSEVYAKPRFGKEIFATWLLDALKETEEEYVVITDCGFFEEVQKVSTFYGVHNCTLIRVHRDGTDFRNDSRSHIFSKDIRSFDVYNNGTLEHLDKVADGLVAKIKA